MGQIGQFDTDTAALVKRIDAHNRFGKNDLNHWIFEQAKVRARVGSARPRLWNRQAVDPAGPTRLHGNGRGCLGGRACYASGSTEYRNCTL